MTLELDNRVALVTGAAGGLGLGIATVLAERGAALIIADINEDGAREAAAGLPSPGGAAHFAAPVDLTDTQSVGDMVSGAMDATGGRLDFLVSNAGISPASWIEDVTDADIERLFGVNMRGAVLVTRAVVPIMKAAGFGRLVYVSSGSGQKGSAGLAVYSATKAFIIGLARAVGQELGEHGITANVVSPSDISPDDEFAPASWREPSLLKITLEKTGCGSLAEVQEARRRQNPMRRLCRVRDVACAVAYLCSENAGFVNAQTIGINGGLLPG